MPYNKVKLYLKTGRGWFEHYPYMQGLTAYNRTGRGNKVLSGWRADVVKGYLMQYGLYN